MKGWHIFLHSLQQVMGNLAGAIRVSALPYLAQFVIMGLLLGFGQNAFDPEAMAADGGPTVGFAVNSLAVLVVAVFASLWIAVGWHRFVLLGEDTAGYVPNLKTDRLWAYFVRSLGIGLILIAAAIGLGMVGGLVSMPFASMGGMTMVMIVMAVIVYIPLAILSFRLSGSLPAAALGNEVDFWAGWNATKDANMDMLVLAVIAVVANLAISLLGLIPVIGIAVQFLGGWLMIMIGASILTTLYGHYIEGRSLAGVQEPPNPFE